MKNSTVMKYEIIVTEQAEKDIDYAIKWYENKKD